MSFMVDDDGGGMKEGVQQGLGKLELEQSHG